jgi:hypothetical protein
MGPALWIEADAQYGRLPFEVARPGALRRALAEGLKRYLFNDPGATDFGVVMQAFGTAAADIVFPQASTATRWAALIAPLKQGEGEDADGQPAAAEPAPRGPRFDTVFCLALHGLCQAFAMQRLQTAPADPEEEDEEGPDGPRGGEEASTALEGGLWAREAQARDIVAALLLKALPRALREGDEAALRLDTRLIAAALLELLVTTLGGWFERRQAGPGQPYLIRARLTTLAGRVETLLAELPYTFTPQPLTGPVAYRPDDPGPADTDDRDYFRVDLIGYRRVNSFLQHLHDLAGRPDTVAPEFQTYLDAVNAQQAVAWRINLPLLALAERLAQFANNPDARETEARQGGLTVEATEELRAWIVNNFYKPEPDTRARWQYQRPGEILDHPLMRSGLAQLRALDADGRQAHFFLPWKADYRGRIYAETPWLTPQGGDLQRALFEFAEGSPLDAAGLAALRRHGANLVKRERVLSDLGIDGRQVVTLEERERWVLGHAAAILASAEAPLAVPFWREVAGKPMQFLAFCLAYRQWTLDPGAPIHLPVQIDGTCNGLQHIAVLTGDADLARAVNVLPRADGRPGDIYSEIATTARETLGNIKSLLREETEHPEGLELADAWLAGEPAIWLNRGTAKKVIMTVPYGARENAQAAFVAGAIAADIAGALRRGLDQARVDALCDWAAADPPRLKSMYRLTHGEFKDLRKLAHAKEDAGAARAAQELQRLEIVTAYAARVIVKHLRHALARLHPSVDRFSAWLRHKANAGAGLPVLWPTPLGFPVCQDKFKLEGGCATATLAGRKTIRVDVQRLGNRVEAHKQRDALLPNLIHSLDATHLALTLNAARDRARHGIGSIHDCLLCHPNDAPGLSLAVRQTFAQLYRPGPDGLPAVLTEWGDWMDGVARLMSLSNPQMVFGALDHPGGLGELLLTAEAKNEGETGTEARKALALIAALRQLPRSREWLMRGLLEFMRQESEADRDARLKVAARTRSTPGLPLASGLPLGDGTAISDYFFS